MITTLITTSSVFITTSPFFTVTPILFLPDHHLLNARFGSVLARHDRHAGRDERVHPETQAAYTASPSNAPPRAPDLDAEHRSRTRYGNTRESRVAKRRTSHRPTTTKHVTSSPVWQQPRARGREGTVALVLRPASGVAHAEPFSTGGFAVSVN